MCLFSGLPSVPTFVESKGVSLSPLPENATYHFITEVFFLCQQAINQGFFIVSKLIKLNRSLANLHKLYKDIVTNGSKEVVSAIKDQINKGKDQIYHYITSYYNIPLQIKWVMLVRKWQIG